MSNTITPKQVQNILFDFYKLKGTASVLPGEIDLNFKIKTADSGNYILKISHANENKNYLNYQQELLSFLAKNKQNTNTPKVVLNKNNQAISEFIANDDSIRYLRLLTWIDGRIWSAVNPKTNNLCFSLGKQCGLITKSLQGFEHPKMHRNFVWDVAQSLWTKEYSNLFNKEQQKIITFFIQKFESKKSTYGSLRKSVVHNDANDNNILVSADLKNPTVTAIIDFGDAIYTQIINDVAIACAYAIMDCNDPLEAAISVIQGYHNSFPLQEKELEHLYNAIAMRLVISVTKSAINKKEKPENNYLLISEKPAWELLKKWKNTNPEFALYSFRIACYFYAHPNEKAFFNWTKNKHFFLSDLFPIINKNQVQQLDLSVSSKWIGHQNDFNNLDLFQYKIDKLQQENPSKIIAGGYLEPRVLYTSAAYDKIGNYGSERRSIHLGIDFWLPEKTAIHALFNGEVVMAVNDAGNKEYGGLIILKHRENNIEFFTLYGHLTVKSATKYTIGDKIKKGQKIAELGNYPENGNWAPHLHFQILLSTLSYKKDFPGVAYHNQINTWKSICPNPNLFFKINELATKKKSSNSDIANYRKQHLGKSLSLQYNKPIKIVRGAGVYLIDQNGKKYLDTVNNVAHVGHENYDVVKAGQEQMAVLNTNSRYLHENINELTRELLRTFPPELNVVHFVNSGSEANELAIRMAKAATKQKDIIASEVGYHGNTNMCVAISSYKFDGKGGNGAPEHTQIFPLPDVFRGKYHGKNAAKKYAEEVKICLKNIQQKGRNVAGLIIEPIISCGGQVELPVGFLAEAYKIIRSAGGICISDEVQTGCGRMGKTFWGFQLHNIIPDVVTIGKPLGNGHPVAAVVCTQKVAEKFANGMEYFNTFGGNPVSCAIATEVLKTVKRKKLQENALLVGNYLKIELKKLAKSFPIIGDVRGQGLFLGIELVDSELNPLAKQTDYLVNRMKDYGILMSSDGPDNNVLKIKPPLVFSKENAGELLFYLQKILAEDFMKL